MVWSPPPGFAVTYSPCSAGPKPPPNRKPPRKPPRPGPLPGAPGPPGAGAPDADADGVAAGDWVGWAEAIDATDTAVAIATTAPPPRIHSRSFRRLRGGCGTGSRYP